MFNPSSPTPQSNGFADLALDASSNGSASPQAATGERPVGSAEKDALCDWACEAIYWYLASAVRDPGAREGCVLAEPFSQRLARDAADLLRAEFADVAIPLGFGELPIEELSLRSLLASLAADERLRRDEYVRVFGFSACRECPPYETEYYQAEEAFFRSQQMADIAGFYQAFGLAPSSADRERPDHLALELEFLAFLLMKERLAETENASEDAIGRADVCRQARATFMRDHLSWWAPSFAIGLRKKAKTGFYAELGRILAAFLPLERYRLGVAPPRTFREASIIETPDECAGCLAAR